MIESSSKRRIDRLFATAPVVYAGAAVEQGPEPLFTVRTSQAPWAYAVAFPALDGSARHETSGVALRLQVVDGAIGVGWLSADRKAFVDEAIVPAGPETVVELVAVPPARFGSLMFRNGPLGGSSTARVLGIECVTITLDPGPRYPGLSEPQAVARWARYYGSPGQGFEERSRVKQFEALGEPTLLSWSDGLALRVAPSEQLSRAVYVSGTYEPNTLCVLEAVLRPGDCFIDVGANVGPVSLAASKWVGPSGCVFSFEASTREFDRLGDSIRHSGASNVTAVHAAVSSQAGYANLRVASAQFAGLNSLGASFAYPNVETVRVERVPAVTLDAFVSQHAITSLAALKVDVEGAEGEVLTGASNVLSQLRPVIVMEVFSQALGTLQWSLERLQRVLSGAGYELFRIEDCTAELKPVPALRDADEQNIVALPRERQREILERLARAAERRRRRAPSPPDAGEMDSRDRSTLRSATK